MKAKSHLLVVLFCWALKWCTATLRFLDQNRVHPLVPPEGAFDLPPVGGSLFAAPPSAAFWAPAPAAPAFAPLAAATPKPTTPDPDPFLRNTSIVLGYHPSSVNQRSTMENSITAQSRGLHVLGFAKDVDGRLQNATIGHLKAMSPVPDIVQPHDNWTEYWTAKRPIDPQWIAPPMTQKINEWMREGLTNATYEVASEVPQMVHDAIMRHTREMVQRMRFKPFPATNPPPVTTTWAPPPAVAPPAAPSAAPAVASPPAAPGAPGAPGEEDPEPRTLGMGYIKGPDGKYYTINLDMMRTTSGGPTTPIFTTTPAQIMGPDGRMYAMPKTPAMVMGANGRMYSVR